MAGWCADNLRDIQAWKSEGLAMTAASDMSTKYFDATLRQLISWIDCEQLGGIMSTTEKMFEAEPDFLMGRILALGMQALGTNRSVRLDTKFSEDLAALCTVEKCTPRERLHACAVNYFANGDMLGACVTWEKILSKHPNDLLALKFAHDAYFFMGDNLGKRDSVARVIEKWSPHSPCYSYLHGMYAFGLEECGEYDKAQEHAHRALSLNRQDCWATHALAHCYEMRSDYVNGIQFLESTLDDWSPCWMLACHNYWHNALFYLEKGDADSALNIFDKEIMTRANKSGGMLDFVDAASILMRIEMEAGKKSVGAKRWLSIQSTANAHINDHVLIFNDAHIAMTLSAIDRFEATNLMQTQRDSFDNFIGHNGHYCTFNDNWRLARDIGQVLCDAVCDFNIAHYEDAFEKLYTLRTQIYRIGGSHAQRDIFTQILINSAIHSSDPDQQKCVEALLRERESLKMNSLLNARLLAQHKEKWSRSMSF